jgi:glycosyltransferase involved in cell wall biosynthesis
MRVLFINKFIPPDPAPTAVLIEEVARVVRDAGGEAAFAGSRGAYRGKRASGSVRWLHEGWENLRMLFRGLTGPRPDVIVCLTDPPGCLVVAAIVARLRRIKLVHWVMDVYPEIAVALGELRAASPVQRAVRRAMGWAYRTCAAIACLDEDMVDKLQLRGDPRAFISTPWPPQGLRLPRGMPVPDGGKVRWLYSGNLGRAHDYETLLRAQRRLEEAGAPFELVFQGGGPCRDAAMRLAADLHLKHCVWLDYAPEERLLESMLEAHVLVATQKPETRGMLWPSKLATMLLLPRALAWVGPTDGAIAGAIRERSSLHGIFAPGDDAQLASWLIGSREVLLQTPAFSAESLLRSFEQSREGSLDIWRIQLGKLASLPR